MEQIKKSIIVGHNEDGIIVARINNINYFSISFDIYNPVDISKIDENYCEEYIEELLEEGIEESISCFMNNTGVFICDIAKKMCENMDLYKKIDLLYPDIDYSLPEIKLENEIYLFELTCCGQCDTRHSKSLKIKNKTLYDEIHKLWDEFHLKTIDDKSLEKLLFLLNNEVDYKDEFEEYFIKNMKDL